MTVYSHCTVSGILTAETIQMQHFGYTGKPPFKLFYFRNPHFKYPIIGAAFTITAIILVALERERKEESRVFLTLLPRAFYDFDPSTVGFIAR